jgi:hypothetical protein
MKRTARKGKGRPSRILARGPTAAEFRTFIREVIDEWGEAGESVRPILSWDNAPIHGSVREGDWEGLGIGVQTHTLLPPYSPDIHSVIELSHAVLMREMNRYIRRRGAREGDGLVQYTNVLLRLFKRVITPEWAQATTHRLFTKVLAAIIQKGGDYPSKHLR